MVRPRFMLAMVFVRVLRGIYLPSYFLAKPMRNRMMVESMTTRYSCIISEDSSRVRAIRSTATQMKSIVKNMDRYFICKLILS